MTAPPQITLAEALAQAHQLMQQGTPEAGRHARELCRRILEVAPSNGNALYFLGLMDFNEKNYPAAVDHLELAIQANPAVAAPYFFLGCALAESQRYVEAEAALRLAVSMQPNQTDFLLDFARVLIVRRAFQEALQHCDTVIGLDAAHARAHALRASALHGLGRFSEAISVCRQALEIDPADANSHYNLAIFLQMLGLVQEAETSLCKAIEVKPDFEFGYFRLAECLGSQGRTCEAIAQLAVLQKINPKFPDLDHQLAEAREYLAIKRRAHEVAGHLKPIFILAPVARCGSTLIQRLFNSSDQIIMFGENEDITRRLPASVSFALSKTGMKADLSAAGNLRKMLTEEWVAGLFPGRSDVYLELALRNFYDAVEHYHVTADKLGRTWGIKEPHAGQLGMLRSLLPGARFICIYRNLFDVARSYKARGWLVSTYDAIKLANEWHEEIRKMFSCGHQQVLTLKYEDLVANPGVELARIEEFTQISGIDRKLMRVKVNMAETDRQGHSVSVHRPPHELTQEEHDILVKYAYEMLKHLGYLND